MALHGDRASRAAVEVALIQISPPVNGIGPEMICLIRQQPTSAIPIRTHVGTAPSQVNGEFTIPNS